jgi:hypothetical protein
MSIKKGDLTTKQQQQLIDLVARSPAAYLASHVTEDSAGTEGGIDPIDSLCFVLHESSLNFFGDRMEWKTVDTIRQGYVIVHGVCSSCTSCRIELEVM